MSHVLSRCFHRQQWRILTLATFRWEKVKSWQGSVKRKRNISRCKLISSSVWPSCCVDWFNVQHRKQFFVLLMSCSQPDILRKCFVYLFFPQYLPVRTNFSGLFLNDLKVNGPVHVLLVGISPLLYRKIPKISPSMNKLPKLVTQKTLL